MQIVTRAGVNKVSPRDGDIERCLFEMAEYNGILVIPAIAVISLRNHSQGWLWRVQLSHSIQRPLSKFPDALQMALFHVFIANIINRFLNEQSLIGLQTEFSIVWNLKNRSTNRFTVGKVRMFRSSERNDMNSSKKSIGSSLKKKISPLKKVFGLRNEMYKIYLSALSHIY